MSAAYPNCSMCSEDLIPDDGELCGACARAVSDTAKEMIAAAEERGRRAGIKEADELRAVRSRITEYLAHGGLFNPDLMDHSAVSRLLQDAGIAIDAALAPRDSGKVP